MLKPGSNIVRRRGVAWLGGSVKMKIIIGGGWFGLSMSESCKHVHHNGGKIIINQWRALRVAWQQHQYPPVACHQWHLFGGISAPHQQNIGLSSIKRSAADSSISGGGSVRQQLAASSCILASGQGKYKCGSGKCRHMLN